MDNLPETPADLRRILGRVDLRVWMHNTLCERIETLRSEEGSCHNLVDKALSASPSGVSASVASIDDEVLIR